MNESNSEKNNFLEKVLESLTHPFYVVDASDYTVKMANSAARFGDLKEVCTCYSLTHQRDQPCEDEHPCPLEEVKRTKQPVVIEHVHYDKMGEPRNMEVHGYPILDDDGNVTQMIEYCLDVTDRKQAEEKMRSTQDMLQLVIDNIPQTIFWKNRDSVFLGCNKSFAEDAGMGEPANIVGKTDYDMPWKKEESDEYREYDRHVMDEDRPVLHIIEPQLQANGKEAWLETNKIPLHNAKGEVVGILGTYEDISERKEYERKREELLEREKRITTVLQQAVVPPDVPTEIRNYRIGVRYQPALREAEIGGDFYDIFDLGEGRVGILLGDVAGKGLPAAIQVSAARYTIRAYAFLDHRPDKVLELTNKSLFTGKTEEGGELTVFFGILDTVNNSISYANAGQEPPVMIDAAGNVEELCPTGLLLNMIAGFTGSERSRKLSPGDRIVMVTDGITEARSADHVFFDKSGVIDYIRNHTQGSPQELADGLLSAAIDHAGGGLQDDAVILVIDLEDSRY